MRAATLTTKDKILQAAAEIAMEVGPVHLSLDAVARRAGLSKRWSNTTSLNSTNPCACRKHAATTR